MFKIGEFSRLTRVTVTTLRYYDEIGLLTPSAVQSQSGYRYYRAEQLPRLNRIIALKDLGFSLETIAALLDETVPAAEKAEHFRQRRAAIEQSIEQEHARLRHLDALQSVEHTTPQLTEYDVVMRAVPAVSMATLRRRVPSLGEPVTAMFEQLEAHVGSHKARAPLSPFLIFHDEDYRETDLEVEACVPLSRPIAPVDQVHIREVEGWPTVACVIYRGSYEQMNAVLQTLLAWSERHRMRIAGPIREVYLRFGADQDGYRLPNVFLTGRADELITEVQLPVIRGETG
jgi:DNA-binding transcriptional MerR regulator